VALGSTSGPRPRAAASTCACSPQPWARTGPGTASDGRPAFDLSRFDQAYFDRLRERVEAAGAEGVYVGVMLFDGWAPAPEPGAGQRPGLIPSAAGNNVNGVGIGSIGRLPGPPPRPGRARPSRRRTSARSSTPSRPCPTSCTRWPTSPRAPTPRLSSSRRVVHPDPGRRLDRLAVLGDRPPQAVRAGAGYQRHPIGMTMQFPVPDQARVNDPLLNGPADWISPGSTTRSSPAAGPPTHGRRRRQGGDQRYRPLHPRRRRRPVGVEDVPARPPPDPDGLRDRRPGAPPRPLPWRAVVRVLRAGPPGHGRHPRLRPADGAAGDDAEGRAQLHRLRPGQPGPRVPGPPAGRGGRAVHRGPGAWPLPRRVVRRRRPPEDRRPAR
jgi:hypothetical protein